MSTPSTGPLKRTPLHDAARAAGARFVDFGGWEMPVQFAGVIAEHVAVRNAAGLFDVSHMGEALFDGVGALAAVQRLVTNDCSRLAPGQSLYTPMCQPDGGIVDDCLVYRFTDTRYLVVINAGNVDKDLAWMRAHAGMAVEDVSEGTALLALQGPRACDILARATGRDVGAVPRGSFVDAEVGGRAVRAARTGYTGEDGFELFVDPPDAPTAWAALMEYGAGAGIVPCGLGARDTLRLEARLCLYGNDIDETTNPYEAGLAWTVKLEKGDFIGRDTLRRVKEAGPARKLVGFEVTAAAIARHGHPVYASSDTGEATQPIGVVTSGTKAPTVGKAIGLAYVPPSASAVGTELSIDVRNKRVPAVVVKTPFYKRPEM